MSWLLKQISISILTVSILLAASCVEHQGTEKTHPVNIRKLPYLGDKEIIYTQVNGKEIADTVYHKIPAFSFINQAGKRVTQDTYKGKIYIADFIFTTCTVNILIKRIFNELLIC
jgi:cytochrome oxidase Cu insertion factor (SCO1/SenC/PrrC family)